MTAIAIADARKQFSREPTRSTSTRAFQSSGLVVERRRRILLFRRPACFAKYVAPPPFIVNNLLTK